MNRSILTSLVCATLAIPALAQAATGPSGTAEVRYTDLALNSDAGRATLDKRIERAARVACTAPAETGSLTRNMAAALSCRADVRKQVARQIAERASGQRFSARPLP